MSGTQARDVLQSLALISIVAIVYGSLVPFEQNGASISSSWHLLFDLQSFSHDTNSRTDWIVNLVLYVPTSLFLFGAWSQRVRGLLAVIVLWAAVVAVCGGVSLLVEFGQGFVNGRVSSLLDVARNTAGAAFGPLAWTLVGPTLTQILVGAFGSHPVAVPAQIRSWATRSTLPYLCLVLIANGLLTTQWRDSAGLISTASEASWLPFVHHFESGLVWSVSSALKYALLYLPAGVIGFALRGESTAGSPLTALRTVLSLVFGVVLSIEVVKLVIDGLRPDSSNAVIAVAATTVGWVVARLWFGREHRPPALSENLLRADIESVGIGSGLLRRSMFGAAAFLTGVLGFGIAATSSFVPLVLVVVLAAYSLLLARHRSAWLVLLPGLLPVLDVTPWTGIRVLTEFDAFVAVSIAFGLWRARRWVEEIRIVWPLRLGLVLLSISYAIGLVLGLWPIQPLDQGAFSDPFSHYAALPPAKAFLSAVLLIWMAVQDRRQGTDVARLFTVGMLLGLASVGVVSFWERLAYPGLLDFNREFRIAASFSSMNTGGGAVEAYLVLAIPFVVVGMIFFKHWGIRIGLIGLLLLSLYALMVTYARAGYGGLVVAWGVLGAMVLWKRFRLGGRIDARILALPLALIVVSAVVAVPVLGDRFARSRLATISDDWKTRISHWSEVNAMIPRDVGAHLFGVGLGRFPETFFFEGKGAAPSARFRFPTESGNTFLRLGVGAPLYVEQIVAVEPISKYELSFRARSATGKGVVNVLLCERTFFYSAGCESAVLQLDGEPGTWVRHEATVESWKLGSTPWYAHRPVKLAIENASGKVAVDVDDVRLGVSAGGNLVENGDFEQGGARWFHSSAHNHLPWHIKNLPLELLFGQGWFGLVAFVVFLVSVTARLMSNGGMFAVVVLASFAGFLAVGIFDSLLDAPRLLTLFYMTAGIAVVAVAEPVPRRRTAGVRSRSASTHESFERESLTTKSIEAEMGVGSLLPWREVVIGILALTAGGWLVTHAPFVPYNLRELPNPSRPLLALLVLSVFIYWIGAVPMLVSNWVARTRMGAVLLAPSLILHGLVAWMLLHFAVLPESIHDVVGSPVLGWPWEWERLMRVAALILMVSLGCGTGALLAVHLQRAGSVLATAGWSIGVAVLLPASYWIVVRHAATDNLVELIASHGAFWAWGFVVIWIALIGFHASVISAWFARPRASWFWLCVAVTIAAPAVGWWLLSAATSDVVTFEKQRFTALQFLLSMDRRNLAQGGELVLRYIVLHALAVGVLALVQRPVWRLQSVLSGRISGTPGGVSYGA